MDLVSPLEQSSHWKIPAGSQPQLFLRLPGGLWTNDVSSFPDYHPHLLLETQQVPELIPK